MNVFLLVLAGFFFFWGGRVLRDRSVGLSVQRKCLVAFTFCVGVTFLYLPINDWIFERYLSRKTEIITGKQNVSVVCHGRVATFFKGQYLSGFVPQIGKHHVYLNHPTCGELQSYLRNPKNADADEIWGFAVYVHEVMHMLGEHDEQKTECKAIQRYYQYARKFGISDQLAALHSQKNFVRYTQWGQKRWDYFSPACAPGQALDEGLHDAVW